MSEPQRQYDPIAWIERLRYVNEMSAFAPFERATIELALRRLQIELEGARN